MADKINISLITYEEMKDVYPYYNIIPLLDWLYKKGKKPLLYNMDIEIDTSTDGTPTESTKPTNEVLNFTTPQQVYLRSDNAGDTSKKIDVIGQKADGTFGQFTLTSDDSDGTTPVDCGTWNFICQPRKNDAWAGNAILDDDGVGTTVFWTCALGASATTGVLIVPDGYHGAVATSYGCLLDDPGSADEGINIKQGDYRAFLSRNQPESFSDNKITPPVDEQSRISFKTNFKSGGSVTDSYIHALIALWE